MNKTERKPIDVWKVVKIGIACVVVLYFFFCPSIKTSIFGVSMGECIAISPFGRLELLGIDKAVMTVGGETISITDRTLIRDLVGETRTATHVRSCCGGPEYCDGPIGKLELYRGQKLVRSMPWDLCCNAIHVYDADGIHWLIPWWCKYYGGYVYLSDELANELNRIAGTA